MMIKKIFVLVVLSINLIYSQDFGGTRIYINPGHGGYDSDDRFIQATGFWESEGNLTKGLYLRDILLSLNAEIRMSRTQNRTSDDLPLSTISADANNYDADFFHSIHSNGFQGTANYTLMLYKETNGAPVYPEAKEMCEIMATTIFQAHRTTTKYTRGDMSFLGFNLGVLRNLAMPGTLSEGSFHDYIPESWRLKNDAYLKHEAWAIAKAFIDYYNLTPFSNGEIAGILRDPYDEPDYFYITSLGDNKRPLNSIKVTLLPDGIVYNGDESNNGFFMFDELAPGTYDLILEAQDHETDTVKSVVVAGNKTTFADRYLEPKPDSSAPVITNYSPQQATNVRLDSDIIIEFSVKMDRVSVEQSFSITPNVVGTFTWESNDRRMIFSPDDFLESGTTYQISVNSFAMSAWNVFIEQPFSSSFSTRSALSLVKCYPQQNAVDISRTVKIKVQFDAPIDNSSLGGKVALADLEGNAVTPYLDEFDYENGWIIFEPRDPLASNSSYQVKLLKGIKDIEGSILESDTAIVFTTEPNIVKEGNSFLDFEDLSIWWQPEQSGSTTGIDSDNTVFGQSSKKAIDQNFAARLRYVFDDDSGGVCRVYNTLEPEFSSMPTPFGMWVFGDWSFNILEFWFRNNSGTNIPIIADTLDWTGWKFVDVDLGAYSDIAKFHSIVITQNEDGADYGLLFFDAALTDVSTDTENLNASIPNKISLEQNYPNPFNPTTTIEYRISALQNNAQLQNVSIKIFDILGREVQTLVNKAQHAGNYKVSFDATKLTSGVYYYQMQYGDFIETKKMIILK